MDKEAQALRADSSLSDKQAFTKIARVCSPRSKMRVFRGEKGRSMAITAFYSMGLFVDDIEELRQSAAESFTATALCLLRALHERKLNFVVIQGWTFVGNTRRTLMHVSYDLDQVRKVDDWAQFDHSVFTFEIDTVRDVFKTAKVTKENFKGLRVVGKNE